MGHPEEPGGVNAPTGTQNEQDSEAALARGAEAKEADAGLQGEAVGGLPPETMPPTGDPPPDQGGGSPPAPTIPGSSRHGPDSEVSSGPMAPDPLRGAPGHGGAYHGTGQGNADPLPPARDYTAEKIGDTSVLELLSEIANDANRAYLRACGNRSVGPWTHARPAQQGECREKMRSYLENPDRDPGSNPTERIYALVAAALGH